MPDFGSYDGMILQMRAASVELGGAWHSEFERNGSPRLARAYLAARDALNEAIHAVKHAEATERELLQREKVE